MEPWQHCSLSLTSQVWSSRATSAWQGLPDGRGIPYGTAIPDPLLKWSSSS